MNFFAHALLAEQRRDNPAWILGSMLPDFASMAGLRLRGVVTQPRLGAELRAGVAFHHVCDDAFHGAPIFIALMDGARDELEARGLDGGPALAIGHVGVELLLDGWLVQQRGVPTSYRSALSIAATAADDLVWHPPSFDSPADRFRAMCRRLAGAPVPEAYAQPDFVAERLIRILATRPALAVPPRHEHEVHAWARRNVAVIAERASELLAEVDVRLVQLEAAAAR